METNNGSTKKELKDYFISYFYDNLYHNNVEWIQYSVYWHESVTEYCIEIDGKWSGYVPEEYVFKAGWDLYGQYSSAWKRCQNIEMNQIMRNNYQIALSTNLDETNFKLVLKLWNELVDHHYFENQYRVWVLESILNKFPDNQEFKDEVQKYIELQTVITNRPRRPNLRSQSKDESI